MMHMLLKMLLDFLQTTVMFLETWKTLYCIMETLTMQYIVHKYQVIK